MRASRLLSILLHLQERGRTSGPALAEELGVSVRTVYRDIDHLSAAGVPVIVERGAAGGFELLDGWRTRLTGLTLDEAQAMFLSGLRGPASQLGISDAMTSAQLKLLAALPPHAQADARRIAARFHLDPVGWYQTASRVDHLREVARAVWHALRLRVRYSSWKRVVDRDLEPLGLVLKAGEWYLVASSGGDPRTYRLSNILTLEVRQERFTRPNKFDLERFWAASVERFEAGLYRGTAVVRVSEAGRERLRTLGAAVAEAVARAAHADASTRLLEVTIPIESIEDASIALLKLGTEGEVLAPAELRERIARTAREMAARHASPRRRKLISGSARRTR